MFCNLSPLAVHTNETLNSLRFATKVRKMQMSSLHLRKLTYRDIQVNSTVIGSAKRQSRS